MSGKAIFNKDIQFENGPFVPKGTVGPVTGMYYCTEIGGKPFSLHESLINEDGTLKMPFITLDNTILEAGTGLEITSTLVTVDCFGGEACVSLSDVMIIDE